MAWEGLLSDSLALTYQPFSLLFHLGPGTTSHGGIRFCTIAASSKERCSATVDCVVRGLEARFIATTLTHASVR
jgi:hypothetical protein